MTENSIPISFPSIYGERIEHIYPEVRITIERITPEVAKQMLETNISNRDLNPEAAVVKAIENGEWELNGATIAFDEDGILIDGQHRLVACAKLGIPIDTLVVRGVEHSAQVTMDTGMPRRLRDYTKMRGYKNYTIVASCGQTLCIIDSYDIRTYFMSHRGGKVTYKSAVNYIDSNYESRIKPLVNDIRAVQSRYKKVNSGTLCAVFDALRAAKEEDYREFVSQLVGTSPACVSVRLLQNALAANATTTDRARQLTQKHVAAYMIKAWNAYMRGDDIKQLKFTQGGAHPESFPEVFLGYE